MKYGQQFASALSGSSEEFQQASIDYKQLKKSIKRIEIELNALGLNAEILRQLLSGGNLNQQKGSKEASPLEDPAIEKASHASAFPRSNSGRSLSTLAPLVRSTPQQKLNSRRKRRQARARAEYELAGTVDHPIPRIRLVFSSESSASDSYEDEQGADDLYRRLVQNDSAQIIELDDSASDTPLQRLEKDQSPLPSSEDPQSSTSHNEDDSHDEEAIESPENATLLERMYGHGILPADQVTPPGSPATIRPKYLHSLTGSIIPTSSGDGDDVAIIHGPEVLMQRMKVEEDEAAADEADAEGDEVQDIKFTTALGRPASIASSGSRKRRTKRHPRRGRREVVINLEYDSEFFGLLNQALTALTELMAAEKTSFMRSVQALAAIVSKKASPAKNKNDLYAWREVFTLWIEAEIFEGSGEMTRGERAIMEIEKRLNWFVDQIGRRNLAKQMRSKDSRKALEQFVELNQELLQLKRIGLANQEAARKILKKHDKRLGLSASQDFPDFVAQQNRLSNGSADDQILAAARGNELSARTVLARTATSSEMTSLVFIGLTTLPHALLTMFTDILLPIIPQIDDYSCIICSDIAWRPIALDCGHRFCVRCLVKMQKRGQAACPACRAPVVLTASKENLDIALMTYQKTWFPKEIRQKQRDDAKEIEKEVAQEIDIPAGKCVIA